MICGIELTYNHPREPSPPGVMIWRNDQMTQATAWMEGVGAGGKGPQSCRLLYRLPPTRRSAHEITIDDVITYGEFIK